VFHLLHIGVRQVNLVDNRDDLEVVFVRQMQVGHSLRLHPLRRVHNQQRPFTGTQTARHLIREIHMPRGVDQVQFVGLPVLRPIIHGHRMRLDGDPPLTLEIHRVQKLLLHVPVRYGPRSMQQPVGQRRLPVVDMRDNAEIAYACCFHDSGRPRILPLSVVTGRANILTACAEQKGKLRATESA